MGDIAGGFGDLISTGGMQADADFRFRQFNANQKTAEQMAVDALQRGEFDAGRVRREGSALQATQAVAYAANGVDSTIGTPAQVSAATEALIDLDVQQTRVNAAREAFGHKATAEDIERQKLRDLRASNEKITGTYLTGAGKIIGGVAKLAGGGM